MSKTKYTPGPWMYDQYGGIFIVHEEIEFGEPIQRQQLVAQCGARDASLIAAAPEMLEALEVLVDAVAGTPSRGRHLGREVEQAIFAIKKAKGE